MSADVMHMGGPTVCPTSNYKPWPYIFQISTRYQLRPCGTLRRAARARGGPRGGDTHLARTSDAVTTSRSRALGLADRFAESTWSGHISIDVMGIDVA